MNQNADKIAEFEEALRQQAKIFLLEKYASMLLQQLELGDADEESPDGGGLDSRAAECLLAARHHVDEGLASQIADLLESHGHVVSDDDGEFDDDRLEGLFGDDADSDDDHGDDQASADLELDSDTETAMDEDGDSGENGSADDLFGDDDDEDESERESRSAQDLTHEREETDQEEGDEDAGVLFDHDIYSGHGKAGVDQDGEVAPIDAAGVVAEEGDEEQQDRRPAVEGEQVEVAFDDEFEGQESDDDEDSEFDDDEDSMADLDDGEAEDGEGGKKRKPKVRSGAPENQAGVGENVRDRALTLKRAREKRKARIQQQKERRTANRQQQHKSVEGPNLDRLAHQISVEDLEKYLGIQVVPDDRAALTRRLGLKMRDPSLRQLLSDATSMKHPYALIPRVHRFLKDGKPVQTTVVNLLRAFPQLFDNLPQIITKYRADPLFSAETPDLDWVVVACEALPESRNTNFMEQKIVIRQYTRRHNAHESRIQRRSLIDALYDIIVVNAIAKENILSKSVDLTSSSVGRQNFACINFGEKGVRINDKGRGFRHPQMGFCPSW